jgi:aminoglycoside 3-N-acetyltransferase I
MADAFGEAHSPLSDTYLDRLLARPEFWAFAATVGDAVVGGLTAHTLPMTAYEGAEVFLYDIAITASYRRRGIGRKLVRALRHAASMVGISTVFVPAEDTDAEALDFYTALGGSPSKVTLFEFDSG